MASQLKDLEQRYNSALVEMNRLGDEIKRLREEDKKRFGLQRPVAASHTVYWQRHWNGSLESGHAHNNEDRFYKGFASTNKAQAEAFYKAVDILAEFRIQKDIVVPAIGKESWSVYLEDDLVLTHRTVHATGHVGSPCFVTQLAAQQAIEMVGVHRIREAFKTLLFLTPESRGEIENPS